MKVSSIIKSPIARKVAASAMLMTAVLGGSATANASNTNCNKPLNQTEVVSKEAAKAVSNLAIQSPQNTIKRNVRSDERLLLTAKDNEMRGVIQKYLTETYAEKGLFHATASIQLSTSVEATDRMLTLMGTTQMHYDNPTHHSSLLYTYCFQPDGMSWEEFNNSIKKENERIMPLVSGYASGLEAGLDELAQRTKGKLSAEACLEYIDNHYKQIFGEDKFNNSYIPAVNNFKSKQTNANSDIGKSNLIAYKTHLFCRDIFDHFAVESPFLVKYLTFKIFGDWRLNQKPLNITEDYYITVCEPKP